MKLKFCLKTIANTAWFMAFSLVGEKGLAQEGWFRQSPLPTGYDVQAIKFTNATTGFAVGLGGTILRTNDGGATWTQQASPSANNLYGVSFTDANTGTAVGHVGTILRTTDGGKTWIRQTSGTTNNLDGVFFTDANTGTAVGGDLFAGTQTILRTTNGGAAWIPQTSGTNSTLIGVYFSSATTGTVVGVQGTILRTTDGGATWIKQSSGTTVTLYAVFFTDANTGIVVGDFGVILRTTDGGATWTRQSTTGALLAISFHDANNGLAVGTLGKILRTTNGGVTWTSLSSGTTKELYGISFADANTVTAVGEDGTILRTINGGTTWANQMKGTANTLYGVFFTNANIGTAIGQTGVILRTTNGGASWAVLPIVTALTLRGVHCIDANIGTVVGDIGTILRTTNGGANWTNQTSGTTRDLRAVFFTDANTGTAVGGSAFFGNQVILRTTNAGATWSQQTSNTTNNLNGIYFSDANSGIVVGDNGTILQTANGGSMWAKLTSGTTRHLFGVSFKDAKTGTVVGGSGTILRTTDAGATWTLQTSGISEDLYSVSFTDANNGTAVGNRGTILRTRDGGNTWTAQASGTVDPLYAVSFTDANTGTVAGWRGIILRTINGGVSFSPPLLLSPANGATSIATNPTLTWSASSGAISYRLQISISPIFSTTLVDQSGITGTSFMVTGLVNNTVYYWRVNASNAGGTSDWSSVWSFMTIMLNPIISLSRDRVEFGEVETSKSKEETFTIDNTGTADLIISNIARTSGSNEFNLVSPISFPLTIKSNDPLVTVTVRFTPSAKGQKSATLTISSNDPQKPTAAVSLTGTGKAKTPLNPPRNLTASGLPGKVALIWQAPATTTTDTIEISYDDGTAETAMKGNFAGAELAVRFTPTSYPVTLIGMGFLAVGSTNNDRYGVKVYLDPAASNRGPVGSPVFNGSVPVSTPGTIVAGFSNPITINGGDFYVALNYISGTTRDFSIGLDQGSDVRRSWLSTGPGTFALTGDLGFPGNLIIRAFVVRPASAASMVASSGLSIGEKQQNDMRFEHQIMQNFNETSDALFGNLDYSLIAIDASPYKSIAYSAGVYPISLTANLLSYNIYRSTSSPVQVVAQNKIGNVNANTTNFDDTNVISGTKYYYVVTAVYDEGESGPSNEVSAPQPKIRLYLTGPVPSDSSLKLSEVPESSGQVHRAEVPGGRSLFGIWGNYILKQDVAGDEFTFHINCATSGRRLYVAQIEIGKVKFDQFFYVDGVTYQPYPPPFTFKRDTVVTASAGEKVSFLLFSGGTASPYSAGVLWGTGIDSYIEIPGAAGPTIPSPPTLASPPDGATGISTNPALKWKVSKGATSYRLQVSTIPSFSATAVDRSGITDTSDTVIGLANNTKYFWRVNATNTGGTSDWSSVWSFTTMTAPVEGTTLRLAPEVANVIKGSKAAIDLKIEKSKNLGGFEVTVKFDPATVQVESPADVTLGPFLGSAGRNTMLLGPSIDNTVGTVSFGGVSYGTQPSLNGDGVLATVRFKAMANREITSDITFQAAQIADPDGKALALSNGIGNKIHVLLQCADVDTDCDVDVVDIQLVSGRWNSRRGDSRYDARYDLDNQCQGDGDIDIVDIQICAGQWGWKCPSGSNTNFSKTADGLPVNLAIAAGPRRDDGTFALFIHGETAAELAAYELVLLLPQSWSVHAFKPGDFLAGSGNTVLPLQKMDSEGRLHIGVVSYGPNRAASGNGVLARLTIAGDPHLFSELLVESAQFADQNGEPLAPGKIRLEAGTTSAVPAQFVLYPNHPNPFNPNTVIRFDLPAELDGEIVELSLYNLFGEKIRELVRAPLLPGRHSYEWNGRNDQGRAAASGIYFARLSAGRLTLIQRMSLVK